MVIWILMILLGVQSVFLILTRREKLPENKKISSFLKPFYKSGIRLSRIIGDHSLFLKEKETLKILYPDRQWKNMASDFLAEKLAISLLILFAGCVMTLLTAIKDQGGGKLEEGNRLPRPSYEEGDYTVYLKADLEGEDQREWEIEVEERQYTVEEIEQMLPEFLEKLKETVLGDNASEQMVNQRVCLPDTLEGYPFQIRWKSSKEEILDRYGVFGEEIPDDGEQVTLYAEIIYQGYSTTESIMLTVYPMALSRQEQLMEDLQKLIDEAIGSSMEKTEVILPSDVDGIKITWQEEKKQNAVLLALLVLCSSIAVFVGKNRELDRKLTERKEQMLLDYPEVVSKITLLIGAGMTVRGAWKKIVMDYLGSREKDHKSRYVYEEMLFTLREMESGIGELEAYQHFAGRCQVQKYIKFISLLEQNIRMGAKGFLSELNREAKDAFEERKSNAKQLGETAGTKLMLPMFLMLGIVMVVIMVPSFLSIGM